MRYGNWLNVITADKATGNALGAQLSNEPGDATAFDRAPAVYPAGTTFTVSVDGPRKTVTASAPPAGYYLGVCCTDGVRAQCVALIASGLPAGVIAQVGDRATLEPEWRSFVESNGYTMP